MAVDGCEWAWLQAYAWLRRRLPSCARRAAPLLEALLFAVPLATVTAVAVLTLFHLF